MATANDKPQSEIQRFFANTNIFITGATGFIGNVLVEKILKSCPVEHVYLLMRSKKNNGPHTRLNKMFSNPLFSRLRSEQPGFTGRVTLITGDCAEPNLGLSPNDEDFITRNINIIIHCAATITFNGCLQRTTFINVRSTRDLLFIARRVHHLKSFVYVSTAFANSNQEFCSEIIYDCHMPGETLISMTEAFSDSFMNSIKKQCLGTWPNTYTLTKCIAENLVKQYGQDMPISIVRPSIVVYTSDEPIIGWFTNLKSIPGLCLGLGLGAIRVHLLNKDMPTFINPADKVANLIITAAWHTSKKSNMESEIPVFNYVPSDVTSSPTCSHFFQSIINNIKKHNIYSVKQVWNQSVLVTNSKLIYVVFFFLYHYIPAWCVDVLLKFKGNKLRVVPLYTKLYTMTMEMKSFSDINFKFDDRNVRALITSQSTEDKILYNIDLSKMNWEKFTINSVRGVVRYILNEQDGNTDAAIKRHHTIMIAYYVFHGVFYIALLYIMYLLYNCTFKIFY